MFNVLIYFLLCPTVSNQAAELGICPKLGGSIFFFVAGG